MTATSLNLSGKTVLVTGATDGLGRGAARALAAAGATVLVHGRDPQRIAETVTELRTVAEASRVRGYRADFSSLAQVNALADELLGNEARLDVLLNNAGIGTSVPGGGRRMLSSDGLELRFAVNYLAGYLLTHRLLGLLTASAPARIVNVSSAGQMPLDFDDLMLEHDYSGTRAYCQSKLAQILFTVTLAEQLASSGVSVTALHPATYMPTKIVAAPVSTLQEGVEATLRLIADPELGGITRTYFNGTRAAAPDAQANDTEARGRLENASFALVERFLHQAGPTSHP